jgi:sirohydrochlorin ferrochelatase
LNYQTLEKIAVMIYGNHWKSDITSDLGVKRHAVDNWKALGYVPQDIKDRLPGLIAKRVELLKKAGEMVNENSV